MALKISRPPKSDYVVSGVTAGGPDDVAPLGVYHFEGGAHIVGFDDNFHEPVIVRAYYDPLKDPSAEPFIGRPNMQYIGYLQFMQLSFKGVAIPPEVYQGRLGDRQAYAYGSDHHFVDFMGPADALTRNIGTPFYTFNGMLTQPLRDTYEFFDHPRPNGSLFSPRTLRPPRQSTVASLFGEISPGLLTAADVTLALAERAPLRTINRSAADIQAGTELYRIALNYLKQPGQPLEGLDESQVAGQVIGDYVLLTLPDPEDFCPTLVVSPGAGTTVVVHVLSDYDMEGLTTYAGREALLRVQGYLTAQGIVIAHDLNLPDAHARGRSGLLTPPILLLPGDYCLELKYWTVAAAFMAPGPQATQGSLQFLSGFTWSALFEFDDDTGSLGFTAVRAPQVITSYPLDEGVRAFLMARNTNVAGRIDTSNFTKAAMRRDNFAAGRKLRFLGPDGAEVKASDA